MNTKQKSKNIIAVILMTTVVLCALICGAPTTRTAYADMGPKPSVKVTIENLDGKICYGTLLSYRKDLGPTSAYSPDDPYIPGEFDPESTYYDEEQHAIWKAFVEYDDPDGYYYQQRHWKCHETGEISWTYYPPSKFKVLLYFPETQTFVSSGIYERYAFHSYFSADLSGTDLTVSQTEPIDISKSYDYTWEIISLFARIIVTVLIELGVAWLFKLRTKKKILTVTVVNVATQTAFNVALNVMSFFQGAWALLWYIPLELAVFVVEAVAYILIFSRAKAVIAGADGDVPNPEYVSKARCVLYSLAANFLSFAAGFVLVLVIPGIF